MSQNNPSPSFDETASILSDVENNSNDDSIVVNDDGWANFNNTNSNTDSNPVPTTSDDWADFASNTESSIDRQSEKITKDDDVFGDYGEVHISSKSESSSLSINCFNSEQIDSLLSTCFPLEPPTNLDDYISVPLPTFTTFNDRKTQLPCFQHSLSLWNILSNISNDPLGIQYQWRKSKTEHLFHQALGVHERFPIKTTPITSQNPTRNSNVHIENNSLSDIVNRHTNGKQSGFENPLTDHNRSSSVTNFNKIEEDLFEVSKTPNLDYYVPSIQSSISTKEEQISSSPSIIHRNNNSILPQQSTRIKTIDLDPGSSTVLNDDVKPPVNSIPNYSFINPKALLLFPTHINPQSMI